MYSSGLDDILYYTSLDASSPSHYTHTFLQTESQMNCYLSKQAVLSVLMRMR